MQGTMQQYEVFYTSRWILHIYIYIYIYSNSVAVIAELTTKNLACSIPESSQQHYAMARINCEAESKMFEDALNQAMRNQQKIDENKYVYAQPSRSYQVRRIYNQHTKVQRNATSQPMSSTWKHGATSITASWIQRKSEKHVKRK